MDLHISFHDRTIHSINNVYKNLGKKIYTEKSTLPLYISKDDANRIWDYFSKYYKQFSTIIITDTVMLARPFLQNMDKHEINIIVYITNRFNWGIWGFEDNDYYQTYSTMSKNPRVKFIADNMYDQYFASLYEINFLFPIIRHQSVVIDSPNLSFDEKVFVYNRGTKVEKYIENVSYNYEIFGENYQRYRDINHILEFKCFLHLPYQTNIMSLWENLGYGVVYFIPSQSLLEKWIYTEDWYYWEEQHKPEPIKSNSIKLSEWYSDYTKDLFIYFDSWDDFHEKLKTTNIKEKRLTIINFMKKHNEIYNNIWKQLL